jgi:general secretion pathway protein D
VDKSFALGVQWLFSDDIGSFEGRKVGGFAASTPTSGSILPQVDAATTSLSLADGFVMGIVGEAITIGGVTFPSIGAVVQAYQSDSDIHIISTPQIMTMDNEEAEVVIATNIPFLTKQDTSQTGVDYSNYEFKDVGTTLKITPQINQERFVRLQIFEEVAQVVDQEQVGLPSTLKRQTQTTVTIKDGNTVVIAGLIDRTLSQGGYSVPCLGKIPVLSWLFKASSNRDRKTNLYFFVTPHIIENPAEAREVYDLKKEEMDTLTEGSVKMYEKAGQIKEPVEVPME